MAKLRRLVETDEGDLAKKEKEYTEYSLDDEFMSDDANFGILTYLREELELGSKVIENYTVTVDNVKYYLKDLYLSFKFSFSEPKVMALCPLPIILRVSFSPPHKKIS